MSENLRESERTFIEEVGVVFEWTGLPRMAGRVFGWLLISDPPYQSAAELAEVLMASKGSISTNIRLLIQLGFVERFVIPGERHDHFRLHEDALLKTVRHGLEDEIKMFQKLAKNGLELLREESSSRRSLLEEMYYRYSFLKQEFPVILERYEEWRFKNKTALAEND